MVNFLAELANLLIFGLIAIGIFILLLIWNKFRPQTKKINSPFSSLTNQTSGELIFLENYKITKINSTPVNYSLSGAKSGVMLIPIGIQTIMYDYSKNRGILKYILGIFLNTLTDGSVGKEQYGNNLSAYGIVEAGKKYILKSVHDDKKNTMMASLVPVNNTEELKKYLAGAIGNNIYSMETLEKKRASANFLLAQKKYDAAIVEYNEVLRMYSYDAAAYDSRSRCYRAKGQHDLANEDCIKVIGMNQSYVAYDASGSCNYAKGQHILAIEDFTKAIKANPNSYVCYNSRGRCYEAKGQYDEAIRDYTAAINLVPDDAFYYKDRGISYHWKGQHDLAITDFSKAIELNSNYVNAYHNRGISYHWKGQHDLAITDFSKVIELQPTNADAYDWRGLSYRNKDQPDLAIADFTKAIELNPNSGNAYLDRGIIYSNKGQTDLAIMDFTKAVELQPTNVTAYNWRGFSYIQKDQHDLAITDFSKAIELNSNYVNAYYNRAIAYKQLRKKKLATLDLEKALDIDPGYEAAKKLLTELNGKSTGKAQGKKA